MAGARPLNILFVTADQFRGDLLSCAGHPVVRTPNLDALGMQGAYLPNSYAPVPVCVPSRYAFMTGRTPISFGMRGNAGMRMPEDAITLPTVLGAAGYRTAAIGKMHFSPWTEPYGFDTFVVSEEGRQWRSDDGRGGRGDAYQQYLRDVGWGGYERAHGIGNNDVHTSTSPLPLEHYHTSWATRTTQRWLEDHVSQHGDRPFFAWCSFTKPHSPYDPPEPYDRLYDPRTFPPPIGGPDDLEHLSPHYRAAVNSHFWDTLGPEQIHRARAFYAGNVTLIDHCVGDLRRTLAQLGLSENTVVCFTADHGDLLGDHGLFFKSNYFRGAWHVPFFLYAPGQVEGLGEVPRFSVSEDVYPTLLSLAGVPPPFTGTIHGQDLAQEPRGGPDVVFGSVGRAPNQIHAARTLRWSYVLHPRGAYEELYDLRSDPDERHNLAGEPSAEHRTTIADLRAQLAAWLGSLGDSTSVDASGRLLEDSAARGWTPDPSPRQGLGLRPY
jgi:arylsulfatase A-like enzyme